jgi:hypothetical protein
MAGNEDDWKCAPHFRQPLLELQPAKPWHAQVEQNASWRFDIGGLKELHGRFVLNDPISDG